MALRDDIYDTSNVVETNPPDPCPRTRRNMTGSLACALFATWGCLDHIRWQTCDIPCTSTDCVWQKILFKCVGRSTDTPACTTQPFIYAKTSGKPTAASDNSTVIAQAAGPTVSCCKLRLASAAVQSQVPHGVGLMPCSCWCTTQLSSLRLASCTWTAMLAVSCCVVAAAQRLRVPCWARSRCRSTTPKLLDMMSNKPPAGVEQPRHSSHMSAAYSIGHKHPQVSLGALQHSSMH